ncbi:MAG TPA: redoxin family protein [Acidobacteriaceae bacterium]|jgi:thiol-disulfide isomerase/thioredoxin|nr:redoxin family protein [Acidobacteriaceae bacterium]
MMRSYVAGAILLGCSALPCPGQYGGTPAARGLDQKGHDAEDKSHYQAALQDFRQAIALDPDYTAAYEDEMFVASSAAIQARGMSLDETDAKKMAIERKLSDAVVRSEVKEFEREARRHPDKPIYLWALGQIHNESDPLKEEQYCRRAVAVDARFVPGYECLAAVADLRGDDREYSALCARVAELEPDSAKAAVAYARTLRDDGVAYRSALTRLMEKFPADPAAAEALYWYAMDQKTDAEKAATLEQLRRQFPPEKYLWSAVGMQDLFALEDRTDPGKARALADEMARVKPQGDDWAEYTGYADGVAKAGQELEQGHGAKAAATLKTVKRPYYGYDMRRELLLNARALDASGGAEAAYAFLVDEEAKHPTDEVGAALDAYGAKLGKSTAEVHAAVWAAVEKAATAAIPFTLPGFDGGKRVSLADFRGRVVMVDFWFPNCGPCRVSFPYLEDLARKYKDKGVVVLAINGMKGQEPFVIPFLRAKGYDFVPLQGDEDWDENIYHVRFYPTSFLIGADGRQYFPVHHNLSAEEERNEALEIDELLAHR